MGENEKVSINCLTELVNILNEMIGDGVTNDPDREAFNEVFNRSPIIEQFGGICGTVISISSIAEIDLDKALDMFVEEMRKELHSEYMKELKKTGDAIATLLGLL